MAEEASKTTTTQEEVVVADVAPPEPWDTSVVVSVEEEEEAKASSEKENIPETATEVSKDNIPESGSFKEESTIVSDLPETEKKALQELKQLIQEALHKHEFSEPQNNHPPKDEKPEDATDNKEEQKPVEEEKEHAVHAAAAADAADAADVAEATEKEAAEVKESETETKVVEEKVAVTDAACVEEDGAKTVEAIEESVVAVSVSEEEAKVEADSASPEEVSIWGVPLLADERSDVILLKFLRARDFKVKDAFAMIKGTIRWRKEFKMEELLEEELGDDLEKAVYMHGFDKEGHPVCYNIYGEFQNKELYKKSFSDEEKRHRFLRWRIQFLEKSIRKLDFAPGGISTIVQVNDLKNSPGPAKWELRQATKQALQLLQDNYPEFVAKQVFINVPWWYLAVNRMISPFLTQRTKSKFVFAGPSKSAETLLRYIAAEQLPVKYGGLSKDGEFGISDAVTEITVRPAAKHTVEFPVAENSLLSWEIRVIGWDVSYGAEFVPCSEGSYTVIIQKAIKVASSEEPVLCNNYKIGEPGKVVLTIDNQSSKKKKLLYRLKVKPSSSD
ncbi:hypothetical protein PHAVU_009G157900 [Phaseolus vulgaris]|uniref:CRAL-TRIO domain-containing protein n=1 Tax=Phaseolus vulgaris TaxID=3885 RepID=V7AW61_PHAVU|nr:hypothetical protein PHAVU_009G157900g [Phaseolus vulgaris]ESW09809.1 hypothetical protein PHAVU_009G157900g [Phaseolus vulgaris]